MTDHRHGESCDVLADNVVTPQEADALRRWLGAAGWLKKFWPANVLSQRINQLLDAPDKKELNDLRDALRRIVECGVFDDLPDTVEIFDDPAPAIVFADMSSRAPPTSTAGRMIVASRPLRIMRQPEAIRSELRNSR